LVELLFSMAIGSLVLILAAAMLGSSGAGYARIGGNAVTEREARAAMSQLASDLGNACFHAGEVLDQSDRLGFLTLQPAETQSAAGRTGDLCAASYYLKDLQFGGTTTRCLMRGFRESRETFAELRAGGADRWFEEKTAMDEPIAFGVVAFEARAKVRDSAGAWVDWHASPSRGPAVIDLRLVVARPDFARKLGKPEDWDSIASLPDLETNPNLETCAATLRFGNDATH
jgi:hypothetical protein